MSRIGRYLSIGCLVAVVATVIADARNSRIMADERAAEKREAALEVGFIVSPNEERIDAAFGDDTEFEFTDTPLIDAMEFVSELHNITIILDEQALREEGILADEPLNRILSGIKLRSALKIVLEPLGCTYHIEDEVLKITTKIAVEKKLVTRVYDVRNLAEAGFDSDALMGVITDTIRVDSWRNLSVPPETNKGLKVAAGKASIASLPGCLVISQSSKAHEEIVGLLRKLQHFTK